MQGVQKGEFSPYAGLGGQCFPYLQHVPIIAVTYTFSSLLPGGDFVTHGVQNFASDDVIRVQETAL